MPKEEIKSTKSPKAIGPYSQAVKAGNVVYCSGQIAIDPKTNSLIAGDIHKQAKQVFDNIQHILASSKTTFDSVVKVNVYLKNMDDFPAMNEIYAAYFKKPYPARATVEVARLPKGALLEVDCIAYLFEKDECCGGCGC